MTAAEQECGVRCGMNDEEAVLRGLPRGLLTIFSFEPH